MNDCAQDLEWHGLLRVWPGDREHGRQGLWNLCSQYTTLAVFYLLALFNHTDTGYG